MEKETIKAIIVDDEPEARDIIASLLADFSEVEVLSKDGSVDQALESVKKHKPDLVFLDIDMPGKDGFQLLSSLKRAQIQPAIIFVTAYNQFAIDAIKHAAFDYLLKPVDIDELKLSIQRYRDEVMTKASLGRIENLLLSLQQEKLKFSSRTGTLYLNPSDIIYCQADGNYTDLMLTENKKQTVSINLGRLAEILPGNLFKKISRSLIINSQYLTEMNRKEKACKLKVGDSCIELKISSKYISSLAFE